MRKRAVNAGTIVLFILALAITMRGEPADAQSTVPPKRLGVLSGFGCGRGSLSQRLAELGWIDGRTLTIDCVSTVDTDQLTLLATELVARRPDVLAASPTAYVRALKQATATIPIVMISTPSPVEMGLVTNLPRPEANITGTAQSGADNTSKRLQLLKQMLPSLARLAIILRAGADTLFAEIVTKDATAAASTLGKPFTPPCRRTMTESLPGWPRKDSMPRMCHRGLIPTRT